MTLNISNNVFLKQNKTSTVINEIEGFSQIGGYKNTKECTTQWKKVPLFQFCPYEELGCRYRHEV